MSELDAIKQRAAERRNGPHSPQLVPCPCIKEAEADLDRAIRGWEDAERRTYKHAALLARERDEARAEVERLSKLKNFRIGEADAWQVRAERAEAAVRMFRELDAIRAQPGHVVRTKKLLADTEWVVNVADELQGVDDA